MSGSVESSRPSPAVAVTAQSHSESLDKLLDEYESGHGLGPNIVNDVGKDYMELTPQMLSKMSAEDCGHAAYFLEQRAMYLQREINKETARVNWAKSLLEKHTAKILDNYQGYYNEKYQKAIANDVYLSKLNDIRIYAQARVDRLSYLPAKVSGMASKLDSMQQTKRRSTNYGG